MENLDTAESWITYIKGVLSGKNIPPIFSGKNALDILISIDNRLLERDDFQLALYHQALMTVYRALKIKVDNTEKIAILHYMFSRIKPFEQSVDYLVRQVLSEKLIALHFDSRNLHASLLASIRSYLPEGNTSVEHYVLTKGLKSTNRMILDSCLVFLYRRGAVKKFFHAIDSLLAGSEKDTLIIKLINRNIKTFWKESGNSFFSFYEWYCNSLRNVNFQKNENRKKLDKQLQIWVNLEANGLEDDFYGLLLMGWINSDLPLPFSYFEAAYELAESFPERLILVEELLKFSYRLAQEYGIAYNIRNEENVDDGFSKMPYYDVTSEAGNKDVLNELFSKVEGRFQADFESIISRPIGEYLNLFTKLEVPSIPIELKEASKKGQLREALGANDFADKTQFYDVYFDLMVDYLKLAKKSIKIFNATYKKSSAIRKKSDSNFKEYYRKLFVELETHCQLEEINYRRILQAPLRFLTMDEELNPDQLTFESLYKETISHFERSFKIQPEFLYFVTDQRRRSSFTIIDDEYLIVEFHGASLDKGYLVPNELFVFRSNYGTQEDVVRKYTSYFDSAMKKNAMISSPKHISSRRFQELKMASLPNRLLVKDKYITWLSPKYQTYEHVLKISRKENVKNDLKLIVLKALAEIGADGGKLYFKSGNRELELSVLIKENPKGINVGDKLEYVVDGEPIGMAGVVMESKEALIVNDYANWKFHVPEFASDFESVIEHPILFNDDCVGVLSVFNGKIFSQYDFVLLKRSVNVIYEKLNEAILEEEKNRFETQRTLLNRAFDELSNTSSLKELSYQILVQADTLFPCSRSTLQKIKGEGVRLLSKYKLPDEKVDEELLGAAASMPEMSKIIRTKEPNIIPDTTNVEESIWGYHSSKEDINSWVGLPLVYQNNIVAIVTMDNVDEKDFYNNIDRQFLMRFGHKAAELLEHRRKIHSSEIIQSTIKKFNTLKENQSVDGLQIIVSEVSIVLEKTHCTLFLPSIKEDGVVLEPVIRCCEGNEYKNDDLRFIIDKDVSYVCDCFKERNPKIYNYEQHKELFENYKSYKTRSAMATPLKYEDIVVGVLVVDSPYSGWFDPHTDFKFLNKVAPVIANYIQINRTEHEIPAFCSTFKFLPVTEMLQFIADASVAFTNAHAAGVINYQDRSLVHSIDRNAAGSYSKVLIPEISDFESIKNQFLINSKLIKAPMVEDTKDNALTDNWLERFAIITIAYLPIYDKAELQGLLFVLIFGDTPYHFSETEDEYLRAYALLGRQGLKTELLEVEYDNHVQQIAASMSA